MQRKRLTCTAEHKPSDNTLAPLKTLKVIYECNCEHAAVRFTVNMKLCD